jgi:hypothetical protein
MLPPSFTTFVTHPYLLPAMVAAGITATAAITAVFFLSETLDRQTRSDGSGGGFKQLMRYKPFQTVVLLYSMNNGVMFSWEAIYPLFLYTRPELGGIGLQVNSRCCLGTYPRYTRLGSSWLSPLCCPSS